MVVFLLFQQEPTKKKPKSNPKTEHTEEEIRRDPINEGTNSMWNNIILIQEMFGRWVCRSQFVLLAFIKGVVFSTCIFRPGRPGYPIAQQTKIEAKKTLNRFNTHAHSHYNKEDKNYTERRLWNCDRLQENSVSFFRIAVFCVVLLKYVVEGR